VGWKNCPGFFRFPCCKRPPLYFPVSVPLPTRSDIHRHEGSISRFPLVFRRCFLARRISGDLPSFSPGGGYNPHIPTDLPHSRAICFFEPSLFTLSPERRGSLGISISPHGGTDLLFERPYLRVRVIDPLPPLHPLFQRPL